MGWSWGAKVLRSDLRATRRGRGSDSGKIAAETAQSEVWLLNPCIYSGPVRTRSRIRVGYERLEEDRSLHRLVHGIPQALRCDCATLEVATEVWACLLLP